MRLLLTLVTAFGLFVLGARQVLPELAGEVVDLKTFDAKGRDHDTRLWIVEDGGQLWLRSTSPDTGWYERLLRHPRVVLKRPGVDRGPYRAHPTPERTDRVNRRMRERYAWADPLLFLGGDPAQAVAVRLEPLEGEPEVAAPGEPVPGETRRPAPERVERDGSVARSPGG